MINNANLLLMVLKKSTYKVQLSALVMSHFLLLYRNKAKISQIQVLPSCTGDVTWSRRSCDWRMELGYQGPANASNWLNHAYFYTRNFKIQLDNVQELTDNILGLRPCGYFSKHSQ